MSNQPSEPPAAMSFARDEWELLTTLPRRVLVAAASAEADSGRRTVAEGLAGIEAIAAGRSSSSRLVREVVAAIFAEEDSAAQPVLELHDPEAEIDQTLTACRHAGVLLSIRGADVDADAYRQWISEIASAVCGASRIGGVLGIGAQRVSLAERRFLDELDESLTG
jgi:hypothetical protein